MTTKATEPTQQYQVTDIGATCLTLPRSSYFVVEATASDTQIGLVLISLEDNGERVSLAHTRLAQADLFLRPVSNLVSNRRNIMARIVEDDHRRHDIVSGAVFEDYAQSLVAGLRDAGVEDYQVPDPVRLFCSVTIHDDGRLERNVGGAAAGSKFVLFASMPLRVAVVAIHGAGEVRVHERMPAKLASRV